jgi:YesN/AraC family two-component response regulator
MPYNILLVDDDSDFREEFKDYFRGYRVIGVGRGDQALLELEKPNEIDLVVLDVRLPESSGTEILQRIKRSWPDLGVIILTGFGSKSVVINALQGEADGYLEKPLDIEKTEAAIEKVLRRSRWPAGIEAEDIEGKMERVKVFLRRNVHKKVTLQAAAAVVALSPKYLSRIFREVTGRKFNRYKLELKIEQAKEWLAETGHSVDMIAYSLGYLNAESFIRIFKKFTGQTPTAYRKSVSRRRSK